MNAELEQKIALVNLGNIYLRSTDSSSVDLNNMLFDVCQNIGFTTVPDAYDMDIDDRYNYANDPIDWYKKLKEDGCLRLAAYIDKTRLPKDREPTEDEHSSVWLIETVFKDHSDFWYATWIKNRDMKSKPWSVEYQKVHLEKREDMHACCNQNIKQTLHNKLVEFSNFMRAYANENWQERFDRAQEYLQGSVDEQAQQTVDEVYGTACGAERSGLYLGAREAYIFGSDNVDCKLHIQDAFARVQYQKLYNELFDVVNQSILCATNCSIWKHKIDTITA